MNLLRALLGCHPSPRQGRRCSVVFTAIFLSIFMTVVLGCAHLPSRKVPLEVPPDLEITIKEVEEEALPAELYKGAQKKKKEAQKKGEKSGDERDEKNPVRIGEGVVLEMSWFGIPAADVTIETPALVEVNGRKAYRVVGKAESNDVFSLFYRIDDRVESIFDAQTFLPYRFSIHADETFRQQKRVVVFRRGKGEIDFWEKEFRNGKFEHEKRNVEKIAKPVFDPVSALYYFRTLPLEVGKSYSVEFFDNDRVLWRFGMTVLRRELLKTRLGTFSTLVLEPRTWRGDELKNKGKHLAWITDDHRRLLLRAESETKLGTIVADVKEIR